MFGQALAATQPQYGQLVGYTPVPGYGYEFELANGAKRKLPATPAAESAARAIDAAKAYQPGAGPMAPPPTQPEQPNRFDPLVSTKGGGELGLRAGGDPANPLDYVVRTQGSAPTKGGMQARGMSVQGGYEQDPERLRKIQASQDTLEGVQDQAIFNAQKAMAERQAYIQAARDQLSKEAVETVRENTVKQQGLDDLRAKYDAAEQDFLATPEKQKKDREGKPIKTFAEALALGLGALGATLARTPNFAAQVIEANRERELRQEEAELRVKKDVKDSLLGRLRDEMGSMELAKQAFRAIRTRQDAMAIEQIASKTQDQARVDDLMKLAATQMQAYQLGREAVDRAAQGEVTKTYQYVPGSSGSRGGYRAPTIEELHGLQGLRKGEADIDKTRAEATRAPGEERQVPHERTAAISGMAAAIGAADRIEKNLTERKMGKDTTFDDPLAGPLDKLNEAAASAFGNPRKPANDSLRADTFEMARGLQLAYGKSDNDAIMANDQAAGSATGADRLRAAQSTKQRAINNIRTELGSLPPAQQQKVLSSLPPDVQRAIRSEE